MNQMGRVAPNGVIIGHKGARYAEIPENSSSLYEWVKTTPDGAYGWERVQEEQPVGVSRAFIVMANALDRASEFPSRTQSPPEYIRNDAFRVMSAALRDEAGRQAIGEAFDAKMGKGA